MVSLAQRKVLAKKGLVLDVDNLKWPIQDITRAKAAKVYSAKLYKQHMISKAEYAKIQHAANAAIKIYKSGGSQADVARYIDRYNLYV